MERCVCRLDGDALSVQQEGSAARKRKVREPERELQLLVERKLCEGFLDLASGEGAAPLQALLQMGFGPGSSGKAFDLHADGRTLVLANWTGDAGELELSLLDLQSAQRKRVSCHPRVPAYEDEGILHALACHPSRNAVYVVLDDVTFRFDVDNSQRTVLATLQRQGPFNPHRVALVLNRDRSHLVTFGDAMRIHSVEDGDRVVFEHAMEPNATLGGCALSPSGRTLAVAVEGRSGGFDFVQLFDVRSGKEVSRLDLKAHDHSYALGFLSEEQLGVKASFGSAGASVYELASGELRAHLPGSHTDVWSPSPDGTVLAVSHREPYLSSLRLLDAQSLEVKAEAPSFEPSKVVFSRDGALLVAGGAGRLVIYKANAAPVALWSSFFPQPVPRATAAAPVGLDAAGLLDDWDGLASMGEFPCGSGYLGERFAPHDARLQVFARRERGAYVKYWVVFQVVGYDEAVENQVFAIGDVQALPERTMVVDGVIESLQETRELWSGYEYTDDAYWGLHADSEPRPPPPEAERARIQRFHVRLEVESTGRSEEQVLTPSLADYRLAGVAEALMSREQYAANHTVGRGDLLAVAAFKLGAQLFHPDVLAHPEVADLLDAPRQAWETVYEEAGLGVLEHVTERVKPSTLPRWQKLAAVLAGVLSPDALKPPPREQTAVTFKSGDRVKIVEGSFAGFEAQVESVLVEGKLLALKVHVFGRDKVLELRVDQVEAVS